MGMKNLYLQAVLLRPGPVRGERHGNDLCCRLYIKEMKLDFQISPTLQTIRKNADLRYICIGFSPESMSIFYIQSVFCPEHRLGVRGMREPSPEMSPHAPIPALKAGLAATSSNEMIPSENQSKWTLPFQIKFSTRCGAWPTSVVMLNCAVYHYTTSIIVMHHSFCLQEIGGTENPFSFKLKQLNYLIVWLKKKKSEQKGRLVSELIRQQSTQLIVCESSAGTEGYLQPLY